VAKDYYCGAAKIETKEECGSRVIVHLVKTVAKKIEKKKIKKRYVPAICGLYVFSLT